MKSHRKQHSKINSVAPGRWTAYMAAAAATSFAAAHTAEADIHYSGLINQKIDGRERAIFHLDPSGGGFVVQHFNLGYGSSGTTRGGFAWFFIYAKSAAANGSVSQACHAHYNCISNLERGDAISTQPFVQTAKTLAWGFDAFSYERYGQFLDRGFGLVGFKFN
jgi:hypothetical protein